MSTAMNMRRAKTYKRSSHPSINNNKKKRKISLFLKNIFAKGGAKTLSHSIRIRRHGTAVSSLRTEKYSRSPLAAFQDNSVFTTTWLAAGVSAQQVPAVGLVRSMVGISRGQVLGSCPGKSFFFLRWRYSVHISPSASTAKKE